MTYVKFENGEITGGPWEKRRVRLASVSVGDATTDETLIAHNVYPYLVDPKPAFDPATHHPPVQQAPALVGDQVMHAWSAPIAKTRAEMDADSEAEKNALLARLDRAELKILFQQENRIRALEGKQPVTAVQFRDAVKALL